MNIWIILIVLGITSVVIHAQGNYYREFIFEAHVELINCVNIFRASASPTPLFPLDVWVSSLSQHIFLICTTCSAFLPNINGTYPFI